MGATLCFRGIDNASYYRLQSADARYYMDYTGCGNTLNMQHPRVLQMLMDSLRYWVTEMHVDGFRFDLASSLARELHEVNRLGAFFDILRQDPVLNAGEAHRRAVGHRRRRLPGRQLPAGLGGMERQVPRHDARLLEGRRRPHRRVRTAAHGLVRSVWPRRTAPAREHQLRHRARRLHAARPRRVQRQAQRGQRRRQSRRPRQQPVVEQRCRRTDGRSAHPGPARAAQAQSDRHAAALAGRADVRRRRRARAHAGREQQRVLPGQPGELGRLEPLRGRSRATRVRAAPGRAARRAPGVPSPALLPGPTAARDQHQGHPVVEARRRGDDGPGVEPGLRALARGVSRRRARSTRSTRAGGRWSTTSFLVLFNAHHEMVPFRLPPVGSGQLQPLIDTSEPAGVLQAAPLQAGDIYPLQGRSLALLQRVKPAA